MRGLRCSLFAVVLAGCGSQATPGASITFDPCEPVLVDGAGATAEQLASLDDAIGMWHARGVTGLARGTPPQISLAFRDSSGPQYGLYDDTTATVYVNLRVTDPAQRTIIIAHELGHALALAHVAPDLRASVMNPGNLTIAPTDGDHDALATRWGACPAP